MKLKRTLFLAIIVLVFGSCRKQNILKVRTLQPGPNQGIDTFVESSYRFLDTNFGDWTTLRTATWSDYTHGSPSDSSRVLINFPALNQMAGHEIDSVKLTLYKIDNFPYLEGGEYGPNANYVFCLTQKWDQSTVTWNTQPTYDSTSYILIPENNDYDSIVVNLTPLIPEEMDKGFGFIFIQQNKIPFSSAAFCSCEETTPTKRPKLTIYYK